MDKIQLLTKNMLGESLTHETCFSTNGSCLNNMEANLNKSLNYIKEAAENQADIVLFPEVQLTNFFPQYPNVNAEEYKVSIDSHIIR